MTQKELLVNILGMVLKSNVCPDLPKSKWPRLIIEAHKRGYLYVSTKDDTIYSVVCAYRTPDIGDGKVMPEAESGTNLYIDYAVSNGGKATLLRMLKQYLANNPDINSIYYYRRNSDDDLKTINLRKPAHV